MGIFNKIKIWYYHNDLDWKIKHGLAQRGRTEGILNVTSGLKVKHIRNGKIIGERITNKVITTAFVNYLVDSLQSTQSDWINFKYHDSGTGTVGELSSNTTLGTPTGIARVVGTQIEGASPNIYKSVGTITYNATFAITEHGLFNASTAGTLMDRSVFSAINVVSGDKIEFTYEFTATAGG